MQGTRWAASLKGKQHAEEQVHRAAMKADDATWLKIRLSYGNGFNFFK